ncbi:MAG: hypothetical protein IJQ39_01270 [Thermoguttaceae bacterium]|nr:hypothetical protein [Thermoguttaceae bacterium]
MEQQSFLNELKTKVENRCALWRVGWLGKVVCSPIFWIEALLIVFVALVMPNPLPITTDDTNSYTLNKVDLMKGYTDIYRTPAYPYFIRTIYTITGAEPIEVRLAEPGEEAISNHVILSGRKTCLYVYYAQLAIWLLTLIPLYKALRLILNSPCLPFFLTLFIGYTFLDKQAWIITEPLAISASCQFFSMMIFYWKRPSHMLAAGINLFALFIMIMLRPAFLILLPLLAGFWIARLILSSTDRLKSLTGVVALAFVGALLAGYCELNKRNHGLRTVSSVSAINLMDILINTGFYKNGSDSEIIALIDSHEIEPGPYQNVIRADLTKRFGDERIQIFTSETIKNNFVSYIIRIVKQMYWDMNVSNFGLIYLVGVVDFLLTLILWISLKTVPWTRLIAWLFFYTMLFGVFYGGQDIVKNRYILSLMPIFYIIFARYIDLTLAALNQKRQAFIEHLKTTA